MTVYHNDTALYTSLRSMFERIEKDTPEALQGLLAQHLSLRFKCSAPAAEIMLDGHQRPFQATYGPAAKRPDLDVALTADTLHLILMDELSMKKAMGSGLIKVRGPAWKLKVLIDLVKAGRTFYPQIARRHKLI